MYADAASKAGRVVSGGGWRDSGAAQRCVSWERGEVEMGGVEEVGTGVEGGRGARPRESEGE